MEESEVYTAIGEQGFNELVAAFYRQVPGDEILGPLYRGRDLAGAEQRLRDFLTYRFRRPGTLHRAARPSPPAHAPLPICGYSSSARPLDAINAECARNDILPHRCQTSAA